MVSSLDEKLHRGWGKITESQGYLKEEYQLVISFNAIRPSFWSVPSGLGTRTHRPGLPM